MAYRYPLTKRKIKYVWGRGGWQKYNPKNAKHRKVRRTKWNYGLKWL